MPFKIPLISMKNNWHSNGEVCSSQKEQEGAHQNGHGSDGVVLGLDGGTTSTVCVCMPLLPLSDHNLKNPLPILARTVAGCSNHNSVGGKYLLFVFFVFSWEPNGMFVLHLWEVYSLWNFLLLWNFFLFVCLFVLVGLFGSYGWLLRPKFEFF